MIKSLPWILSGLILMAVIYLFFLLLNSGTALDDSRSQTAYLRERSDLALSIIRKDWIGKGEKNVAELSEELERKGIIVGDDGNNFKVGDLIFKMQKGSVVEVHYID